ncbi:MAG: phosphate acetyltransferase [Burkholderiales bacterium PBB4]|nr:MAG: phosphate acetyltransferase [Burkholderiales bacterium PBB4]
MQHSPIIALDGDGVLLDYNLAYASAWERAFGVVPRERDPKAYWAMDRWEVEALQGTRLERFRGSLDESFWESIPAMPGALEACHALKAAGYTLVCVTALADRFGEARLRNLQSLGFPIDRVITTGNVGHGKSPKAQALEALKPVAFVDDFLPYLLGIEADMHLALILRDENGSPNVGEDLHKVDSTHGSLLEFSRWWLNAPCQF